MTVPSSPGSAKSVIFLWDCNYCETINDAVATTCIACEAVKTELVERPVLRHPLLERKVEEPKSSVKTGRGSTSTPSTISRPTAEPPFHPSTTGKKSFWKKVFGE
jgi:hypothetical protein